MQKNDEFYRAVLNAMPMPVFIIDDELRVRDLNHSARHFFELERDAVISQLAGELLHCLYANGGCGHAEQCETCLLRQAVRSCTNSHEVTRRRMKFSTKRKVKFANSKC